MNLRSFFYPEIKTCRILSEEVRSFRKDLGFGGFFLGKIYQMKQDLKESEERTTLRNFSPNDGFQHVFLVFFVFISLGCWKGNPHFFTKYAEGCVWCPSSPDSFSNTLHMIRVVEADRLELFSNCPFDFLLHD